MEGSMLPVNGASLYYKTIGTGPLLVFIPVSNGSTLFYEPLASYLSSHFCVLLYDRRGYHRSPADERPATNVAFETHAGDTAALIEHVSSRGRGGQQPEPAFIFTSSGSSGIAMELLTSRPHLVRKIILHEIVLVSLIPEPLNTYFHNLSLTIVAETREGNIARGNAIISPLLCTKHEWRRFKASPVYAQLVSSNLPPEDMAYYLEHEILTLANHVPDLDKLQHSPYREKIELIRGNHEAPDLARIPGETFQQIVGASMGVSPGGHLGYVTHPKEFAEYLGCLLAGRDGPRL